MHFLILGSLRRVIQTQQKSEFSKTYLNAVDKLTSFLLPSKYTLKILLIFN